MAQVEKTHEKEFWLFREEPEPGDIEFIRSVEPNIDFSSMEGITELIDRLYHILD